MNNNFYLMSLIINYLNYQVFDYYKNQLYKFFFSKKFFLIRHYTLIMFFFHFSLNLDNFFI